MVIDVDRIVDFEEIVSSYIIIGVLLLDFVPTLIGNYIGKNTLEMQIVFRFINFR